MIKKAITLGVLILSGAAPALADPTPPATTQAAIPADQSTPRGALHSLAAAMDAGDGDKIRSVLIASNPQERKMVDTLVAYHGALAKFGKTAVDVYGAEEARKLTGDTAAAAAAGLQALQAMPETITGDTAIVGDQKETQIQLTRADGKWRVPVGLLARDVEQEKIEKVIQDMQVRSRVITEATAEMQSGQFKSAEDASQALQLKMMKAAADSANPQPEPSTKPSLPPS
jgi:hypothetical protein